MGEESKQAKQVKVCLDVAKRAKRVVMLSGTPSLSKPFQIFNQVYQNVTGCTTAKEANVQEARAKR